MSGQNGILEVRDPIIRVYRMPVERFYGTRRSIGRGFQCVTTFSPTQPHVWNRWERERGRERERDKQNNKRWVHFTVLSCSCLLCSVLRRRSNKPVCICFEFPRESPSRFVLFLYIMIMAPPLLSASMCHPVNGSNVGLTWQPQSRRSRQMVSLPLACTLHHPRGITKRLVRRGRMSSLLARLASIRRSRAVRFWRPPSARQRTFSGALDEAGAVPRSAGDGSGGGPSGPRGRGPM